MKEKKKKQRVGLMDEGFVIGREGASASKPLFVRRCTVLIVVFIILLVFYLLSVVSVFWVRVFGRSLSAAFGNKHFHRLNKVAGSAASLSLCELFWVLLI